MHELLAKSDRQLGMCLRMLYDEGLTGPLDLQSALNSPGTLEFRVEVPVAEAPFEKLKRRLATMIG